jgi:hypothetical protein
MTDNKIVLLADVYKMRETKEKELAFYTQKLKELEEKMFFIRKEIQTTTFIIDMIEKEKVQMIGIKNDKEA